MTDESKKKLEALLDAMIAMVIDAEFNAYENDLVLSSVDSLSELIK